MSLQQAAGVLPILRQVTPPPGSEGKALRIAVPGYTWHDCVFVATFVFAADGLYDVEMVQTGATQPCRDDTLTEFTATFGPPPQQKAMMGFVFYTWPGDDVTVPDMNLVDKGLVSANGYGVTAHLHKTGAPDVPPVPPRH